jgi:hypothetical protein
MSACRITHRPQSASDSHKNARLLDDPIGTGKHCVRDLNTQHLRSLQIDRELDLGRLLHGQLGGVRSIQYALHITSRAPVILASRCSIANERTSVGILRHVVIIGNRDRSASVAMEFLSSISIKSGKHQKGRARQPAIPASFTRNDDWLDLIPPADRRSTT